MLVLLALATGLIVLVEVLRRRMDRRAPPRPPEIALTDWGGVLLECGPGRVVAVVLPTLAGDVPRGHVERRIDALIGVPGPGGDAPPLDEIATRLGVDTRKIRRDVPVGSTFGSLRVERTPGGLRATWAGVEGDVLVGAGIPLGRLAIAPYPTRIIGSFVAEVPPDGAVGGLARLRDVLLLTNVVPGNAHSIAVFFSRMGVTAHLAGAETGEDAAHRWLRGLDAAALPEAVRRVGTLALERALLDTLVEGDRETARRLAEASDEPVFRFHRGILHLLDGRVAEAADCFEAATEGFPEAWASLAAACLDLDRADDARRAVERGLAALPDDAITVEAAVRVFARLGERERALGLLAPLPMRQRVVLEAVVERGEAGGHRFPELAARATQRATTLADAGDTAGAEAMLRRALTFDPSSLEAAGELGWLLGTLQRDDEAVAHYDAAIERVPGGELLRFNRGNALLRLGRSDEAVADYARLAELVPEWIDPQINLIGALCARRDAAGAEARLAALRARPGVPAEVLAQLEAQVARLKS